MGTVSEYLDSVDDERRDTITAMMTAAREQVPEATEGMSYGMPALLYRKKPLLAIMAAKGHIGLYPFSAAVVAAVAERLEGHSLSKGTIRFTVDQPLPNGMLSEIVALRVGEIESSK